MRVHRQTWSSLRIPGALALAAVLLALLGLASPAPPVHGAGPSSVFYYESDPDNPLGQGTADIITSDDEPFAAGAFGAVSIGQGWRVAAAGPGGTKLVPGTTYTDARGPGHPTAAWLELNSQRLYSNCHDIDGTFTVHDVGYYGSAFSKLAMSFTATCGSSGGIVHGELRFNASSPPFDGVTLSPLERRAIDLGAAAVGGTGGRQTVTLENVGAGAVTVGPASVSGSHAASFEIVDDTCTAAGSLPGGASCSLDVRLAPATSGSLEASVVVPVGTRVATRKLSLKGVGQTPTTTTIDGPSGWQWPPIDLRARVSPVPTSWDSGNVIWFWFPDEPGPWDGPWTFDDEGTVHHQGGIPPGVHRVYAEFNATGIGTWANSRSETITLKVMRQSSIRLETSDGAAYATEPPTIVASLQPTDFVYAAGQLSLTDVTTGTVLGSIDVGPGRQEISLEPFLTGGNHVLRAEYTGYEGVAGSSAEMSQRIIMEAGAQVNGSKFYPAPDGFRDTLTIEAWREHPLLVEIAIESSATSEVVRTQTYPPDTDWIRWAWDGRDDDGALVAAGKYRVHVRFKDGGEGPKIVSRTVTVSRHRVRWRSKSVTLKGRAYVARGKSRNGSVSRSASRYLGGVRLASGKGSASVAYAFPVARADVYGKLTLAVRGRSTNGHKGLIAIWNPNAGSHRDASSYDAARLVGPGDKWWKTSVPADDDRVRDRKVRALVGVAKGMGKNGPAIFDIRSVRLTYQLGTLVAPTSSDATAEPPADERDGESVPPPTPGTVGRLATELAGGEALPRLRSRITTPDPASPDRAGAAPSATASSVFAFENHYGDAGVLTSDEYVFDNDSDWYSPIASLTVSDGQGTFLFAAQGPDGARLEAGRSYEGATDYPQAGRAFFKLDAWTSCYNDFGRGADFTVHDVAYDAEGRFERLSLSFAQPRTTGEIRYHTSEPGFAAIHQSPFCPPVAPGFPNTHLGDTAGPVTRTLTNLGSGTVGFGQAGIVGDASSDFDIVADTCSGATLATSESCTLAATFTPTRMGTRDATLGIAMDYGTGARMIGLYGRGTLATTTTLSAPTGSTWSPVTLEAAVAG